MPYIPSPMEKFNKNNPFIILAKKEYDQIMDTLQEFSKNAILHFIITGTIVGMIILLGLIEVLVFKDTFKGVLLGIFVVCILILLLSSYLGLEKRLKWYMGEHPAMIEFDRLANLEVNAILTLHNEDILKALHSLYSLRGALDMDVTYCIQRMRYLIAISTGGLLAAIAFILTAVIY